MTAAQLKARGLSKHPGGRPPIKSRGNLSKTYRGGSHRITAEVCRSQRGRHLRRAKPMAGERPKFFEEVELAKLASVKERWDIIQAAARGNADTPGDWHAAAWSVETNLAGGFRQA